MHRILAALIASAALLALAAPASAQTGALATPTKAAHMSSMSSSMKKSSSMGAVKMAPTACPKGQSMVKGYTKKDGTKVAAYCRKSK
jgi:curli biogenesis system outer membrane secretion channel CsgG